MSKIPSPEELIQLQKDNPELAKAIIAGLQLERDRADTPDYVKALFGPQLRFFDDQSKKKTAVCSRRAGKTEVVGAWLLDGARDDPGGLSVYIALSRNNCRIILWATLIAINRRHNLKLRFREIDNQLMVETPNGHKIWLAGCKDTAEIEKFRGIKLRRAAIDEGASYGSYLKALVQDVLEPALLDLNGEICIIGTPGVIPAGFFYDVTTGAGTGIDAAQQWSTHHWTVEHNPHIQIRDVESQKERNKEIKRANAPGYVNERSRRYLNEKLKENNWSRDHPTFRREFLGEWVRDEGALVYPYDKNKNKMHELPESSDWTYAMGIDVGYVDSTAFVVGAYRRDHPEMYIVYAEKREHMIPSSVAAHIERLQRRFGIDQVVMDTGGIGKGYAEECSQRYGLYIEPAEKTKKRAFIEIVRGELLSGSIKFDVREASELLQEMGNLVWDDKREKPSEAFDDHLCFAAGTMVDTPLGPRPIEDLDPGECVLTQSGIRHILATCKTEEQKLFEVTFSDGRTLRGTASHPIATPSGWCPLGELKPGDECWQCYSMAQFTEDTPILTAENWQDTMAPEGGCAFTSLSGSSSTWDVFANGDPIFTTKMEMHLTTTRKIWKRLTGESISPSTLGRIQECYLISRDEELRSGMAAKRVGHGTGNMPFNREQNTGPGPILLSAVDAVKGARRHTRVLSSALTSAKQSTLLEKEKLPDWMMSIDPARAAARASVSTSTQPENTVRLSVEATRELPGQHDVYGLTVEGEGCFLSEGILAMNCDALIYLIRALLPDYNPQIIEDPLTPSEVVNKQAREYKKRLMLRQQKAARRRMRRGDVYRDIASGK